MKKRRGFANPEPMILIALIGIVLAILIPKFMQARQRYRARQNLAQLRGALAQYAADTKTSGPPDLAALAAGGRYLKEIPEVRVLGAHTQPSRAVNEPVDSGGWTYDNGRVYINCTHTDYGGKPWSSY